MEAIQMQENSDFVEIYFKVAYTTNIKYYKIYKNWSIAEFINIIKETALCDFKLKNLEFVEAGQPGISEEAAALVPENITFWNKYSDKIPYLAYYIRPIPLPEMHDLK